MDRGQPVIEDLPRPHQVVQVGRRVRAAGVAVAALFDGPFLLAVARAAEVDAPLAGEEAAVASDPGRQGAVEHVDAAGDALDQVVGGAHAHEVARLRLRHVRRRLLYGPVGRLLRLPNGDAADGYAGEVE